MTYRLIRQSMIIAAGLAALKLLAGHRSNSLGILASALDSLMDFCSSAINYVSLRIAASPPDEEHPYGHGKAECLAGLAQGTLIVAGAVALLAESARRVWMGTHIEINVLCFGIMGLGTVVSAAHGYRLRRAANREPSVILNIEGFHFGIDVFTNLGVVAALAVVGSTGNLRWDFIIFGFITAYILFESARIIYSAAQELMDRRLPAEIQSAIKSLVLGHHPSVVGFHKFKTRKAGNHYFIDLHIEIRGIRDFEQAHEITESLIDKIKSRLPNSEVTIHYDPEGAR